MKKRVVLLTILLCMLIVPICARANGHNSVVFLTFSDNTEYKQIKSHEILSEYLLSRMCELSNFNVMEQGVDIEVFEIEKKLNVDNDNIKEAKEKDDFEFLMNAHENSIHKKQAGQFLPEEFITKIGKKYNADYIFHGSVEYLGADVEVDTSLVPIIGVEKTKPYLIAVAFVRLIDATNGQVVWTCQAFGKAKDHLYTGKGIRLGTGELNSQLFYEAIDKTSEEIIKLLQKDLKKGRLVLKKGEFK